MQHLGHASGPLGIGKSQRAGIALLGQDVPFDDRILIRAVAQDRPDGLGLHIDVHDGEDRVVTIPLPGGQLAAGERRAVTHIFVQGHAGQGRGVAEHLGYDRDPVRFLQGDGRGDPLEAVHFLRAIPSR